MYYVVVINKNLQNTKKNIYNISLQKKKKGYFYGLSVINIFSNFTEIKANMDIIIYCKCSITC